MKKWVLRPRPDAEFRRKFSKYSGFIQNILFARGIKTRKQAETFFELAYDQGLNDFYLLGDMRKAVKRILKAIKKKEKLAIYGDYDADGVTAATVLNQFFLELGIKPVIYIPDRVKEGYGLNQEAGNYLNKKKVKLVITVDTGVRNALEVEGFRKMDIEVVITDHHAVPDDLPKAVAIIDPHKKEDEYPFCELSGAGVAFKLVQALVNELGVKRFSVGFEKWLLDLVAVGTIADLVPLLGENRVLVKYGLVVLSRTKRQGLKYLMEAAGISYEREPVRSTQVAFQVAPRINAAGRMDHANNAFMLLNEGNSRKARKLAEQLEKHNRKRQSLTSKIFDEIEAMNFDKEKAIIAGSRDWPLGILGLVAGRLCDKYSRPTLVYTIEGDEIRGSARSITEFNIIKALDKTSDLLLEYGGHKQAAGFTLAKKNLRVFERKIKKMADEKLDRKDLTPKLMIDYRVGPGEISGRMLEELKALEPFGAGNPEPLFLLEKAVVQGMKLVGRGQNHLKLVVKDKSGGQRLECIGFNFACQAGKMKIGEKVDIVFNLACNYFNGGEYLELRLVDIKLSGKNA
ncbi:MAG: single-stranded-DNA-specific exonuclease RecJ [Patescibacteria group bacterium]|nr:single-stranded-DNA-specific exonuclease RecJ [Patescibacteria group bacterium]